MSLTPKDNLPMPGVVAQSLGGVSAQQHSGVLAGAASHEDEFEFVLAAGLFGAVDGFDDGGVGEDLGAEVADCEVGVGVVASDVI